jgi:hypothetical protein
MVWLNDAGLRVSHLDYAAVYDADQVRACDAEQKRVKRYS